MAINKIQGNILSDNLQRGANLAIQGNLIYFDVVNDRVGIKTTGSADDFTVAGTANVANVRVTSATANGIFYAGATQLALTDSNLTFDGSTLTLAGTGNIGNVTSPGTITATGNVTGGNIITTGTVDANSITVDSIDVSGNLSVGNLSATGDVVANNVTGNSTVASGNIIIDGITGNIDLAGGWVNNASDPVANTDLATKSYVDNTVGNIQLGNFTFVNTTISTSEPVSDITLTPTGNGIVIISGNSGIQVPVGNTAQQPAPAATGTIRFNTELGLLEVYDGTTWMPAGGSLANVINQTINPDGFTNTFTLTQPATDNTVLVTINGIMQTPSVAYSVTGNSIAFADTPQIADTIQIRFISVSETFTFIDNGSGNALVRAETSGNITVQSTDAVLVTGNILPTANNTYTLGSADLRWQDLWLSGNTMVLGNIVVKNTSGNTIGFFGPDGTTPATLDANAEIISDSIASGTSDITFAAPNGNIIAAVNGATALTIAADVIDTAGNVSAAYFIGNGSLLSGVTVSSIAAANVTGLATVATTGAYSDLSGAPVLANVATTGAYSDLSGAPVLANVATTGAYSDLTGTPVLANVATTGDYNDLANLPTIPTATSNLVNDSGFITVATANVISVNGQTGVVSIATYGNADVAAYLPTYTGNLAGGNLDIGTGTATLGNVINSNGNGVGNIGSSTGYFNTIFAKATSAQYADVAEKFISDNAYEPGTVLIFGGTQQVTVSDRYADTRAAGVVSTDPAYLMNSGAAGTTVDLALTGQVPCSVVGPVDKGDILTTSDVPGHACRLDPDHWRPGVIIGKALESCGTGNHRIMIFVCR